MRQHRTITIGVVTVFWMGCLLGCDVPNIGSIVAESSLSNELSIEERQHRDLRVVFLFYDQNELRPLVDQQIAEIVQVEEKGDRVHVVIARASNSVPHGISYVQDRSLRHIKIEALPRQPLEEPETLDLLLRGIATEFPASKQLLVVSGHGRGWRGIGTFDADRQRVLTGDILARAVTELPPELSQVVILEAGWSGFADMIFPFRDKPLEIITAPFNIVQRGMNHARWIELSQRDSWHHSALLDHLQQEMMNAATDHTVAVEPILLTSTNLADLGSRLGAVVNSAINSISIENLETLREHLLNGSTLPPGSDEAHITFDTLCEVISGEICGALGTEARKIALHLVTLDGSGKPKGVAEGYFTPEVREKYEFKRALAWAPDPQFERGFLSRLWFSQ